MAGRLDVLVHIEHGGVMLAPVPRWRRVVQLAGYRLHRDALTRHRSGAQNSRPRMPQGAGRVERKTAHTALRGRTGVVLAILVAHRIGPSAGTPIAGQDSTLTS